ncbi:Nucleic acid-binding, OB-fold [Sesbania bispinosa]|nr:Nucleic acid-binding, OB-fold [Sesbania bispinosa]
MCAVATPRDPYAMQMVFVDEEGGKIEAIIQKQYMKKFAECLVEGEVYKITNFGVNFNGGKFRAAGHDYKLLFTSCTKVTLCPGASIPGSELSLLKTSEIKKTKRHSDYLVDFMGVVIAVSEELNINREGRQTRLVGKIRCAVFGDLINVVMEFLVVPQNGLPVVIIQFARVNLYKGEVGIQNVMNASKILWNPDLPLAVDLAVHEIETEVAISTITDRRRASSMRDEFLKLYKVKRLVSDGNDNAHFILWDLDYYSLLNKTCKQMLDDIEGQPAGFFPEEIMNLIKKVCCDVDILAEYKEQVDDETPLKTDANGQGLELSTCCKSIVTELEITPPSCVASSSNVEESGSSGKRDGEEHEEAPLERKKRARVRAVKVEKN